MKHLSYGRYDATTYLCEQVIFIDKHNFNAYLLCAIAHSNVGRIEEAIKVLERVPSELIKSSFQANKEKNLRREQMLGTFYSKIGQKEMAILYLENVLKLLEESQIQQDVEKHDSLNDDVESLEDKIKELIALLKT